MNESIDSEIYIWQDDDLSPRFHKLEKEISRLQGDRATQAGEAFKDLTRRQRRDVAIASLKYTESFVRILLQEEEKAEERGKEREKSEQEWLSRPWNREYLEQRKLAFLGYRCLLTGDPFFDAEEWKKGRSKEGVEAEDAVYFKYTCILMAKFEGDTIDDPSKVLQALSRENYRHESTAKKSPEQTQTFLALVSLIESKP